jgi:hypothetical protein
MGGEGPKGIFQDGKQLKYHIIRGGHATYMPVLSIIPEGEVMNMFQNDGKRLPNI